MAAIMNMLLGNHAGGDPMPGTPLVYNFGADPSPQRYTALGYDPSTGRALQMSIYDIVTPNLGQYTVVTPNNGTMSGGATTVYNNSDTDYVWLSYDSNVNKFLLLYRDDGAGEPIKARSVTLSSTGNTATFGTVVNVGGKNNLAWHAHDFHAGTNTHVSIYDDDDGADNAYSRVMRVNANGTVTLGTNYNRGRPTSVSGPTMYNVAANRLYQVNRDGTIYSVQAVLPTTSLTASFTGWSNFGTTSDTTIVQGGNNMNFYIPASSRNFLLGYYSSQRKYWCFSGTGPTVTSHNLNIPLLPGADAQLQVSHGCYDPNTNKVLILFTDYNTTTAQFFVGVAEFAVSGSTLTHIVSTLLDDTGMSSSYGYGIVYCTNTQEALMNYTISKTVGADHKNIFQTYKVSRL